jgi:hypothetical protein
MSFKMYTNAWSRNNKTTESDENWADRVQDSNRNGKIS